MDTMLDTWKGRIAAVAITLAAAVLITITAVRSPEPEVTCVENACSVRFGRDASYYLIINQMKESVVVGNTSYNLDGDAVQVVNGPSARWISRDELPQDARKVLTDARRRLSASLPGLAALTIQADR
ncbi:MAG TPA: hypothetical protein VG866_00035 [Candidatus Paceibacterota bacterium]|nr:hypothetical protein [Candidatus Paceibacterota bacterium]